MEQSGIYKVVFYENKSIAYFWNSGIINDVYTAGQTITLSDCEMLNFIDIESIGANNRTLHDYTISFRYYDLSLTTIEQIIILNNTYGWIPVIYFRNDEIKVIQSPFVLSENLESLETNKSNSFNLELKPSEKTLNELIDVSSLIDNYLLINSNEYLLINSTDYLKI